MLEYCFNACAPSNISKIINLKYSKRGGDCPPQFKMWGGHVPPVNTGRNASGKGRITHHFDTTNAGRIARLTTVRQYSYFLP